MVRCASRDDRNAIARIRSASSPFLYRARNLVEGFFNKIKHCRRVATPSRSPFGLNHGPICALPVPAGRKHERRIYHCQSRLLRGGITPFRKVESVAADG